MKAVDHTFLGSGQIMLQELNVSLEKSKKNKKNKRQSKSLFSKLNKKFKFAGRK